MLSPASRRRAGGDHEGPGFARAWGCRSQIPRSLSTRAPTFPAVSIKDAEKDLLEAGGDQEVIFFPRTVRAQHGGSRWSRLVEQRREAAALLTLVMRLRAAEDLPTAAYTAEAIQAERPTATRPQLAPALSARWSQNPLYKA